jgi:hypothetical protein
MAPRTRVPLTIVVFISAVALKLERLTIVVFMGAVGLELQRLELGLGKWA